MKLRGRKFKTKTLGKTAGAPYKTSMIDRLKKIKQGLKYSTTMPESAGGGMPLMGSAAKGHVHGPHCNHDYDHEHGPDCNHDHHDHGHIHGPDCNHDDDDDHTTPSGGCR